MMSGRRYLEFSEAGKKELRRDFEATNDAASRRRIVFKSVINPNIYCQFECCLFVVFWGL